MTMMSVVRVLVVFAAFTFIAQSALSLAAEETAKPKKTKATLEAKAPAEAKPLAKVPGSPGILATKASGADKVAKARSCSGVTPKIRKVSPDEGATGAKITITTPGGIASSPLAFSVVPSITSFSPTSGPVGTAVTITGNSFKSATKVTFGGVAATSFQVISDTQVDALVPTGAVTGPVAVTTPGGTGTSATNFTVTP